MAMPGNDPEFLQNLIASIDKLTVEMHAHKDQLRITDRRSKWARSSAAVGLVVGAVGVAVGLGGLKYGHDLASSRRDAQESGCVQANLTTQRIREALAAGVSVLTQPNPSRGEQEQAAVDRFVVEYTNHVNSALPYRDCSDRGIDAYYDHPPVDPALGE